ncbi:MAG: acyltransferase family protein [Acetatifactor sp.]|nr:acyltransferase family protein [Acetatifactor sp.]
MSGTEERAKVKIKQREAFYCNMKLLLIFMVVYGHLLEGIMDNAEPLIQIYRIIYSVHMPLFLFLSGLFLKNRAGCVRQMKQALLYYAVCQTAVVAVGRVLGQQMNLGTPVWHLWYLLSLGCMAGVGWCWFVLTEHWQQLDRGTVKVALLAVSVLNALAVGEYSAVGRWLSLSRTFCFLPFFLAGVFCPENMDWKSVMVKIVGFIGMGAWLFMYLTWSKEIPTAMFYQADSYDTLGVGQGVWLRMICILLAVFLGLFLLVFVPNRRLPFSKVGADTFWIYLLHAPFVKLFELIYLPWHVQIAVAPFLAICIILLLYKLFQWKRQLYCLPQRT